MFVIRCIPIVGTAVTAVEAVGALIDGDGKKFFSKLAQTAVGGVMDAAFIMSGGASSIVTAPLKGGVIEGGKIAGKKAIEQLVVREAGKITTNVAVRAASEIVADQVSGGSRGGHVSRSSGKKGGGSGTGGGGNDPPRYPKLPREHEMDDYDYDSDLDLDSDNPITYIKLGSNGRVELLKAKIQKEDLRQRVIAARFRRNIPARVRRFVSALGQVKDSSNSGTRESDEVGHIIADSLGGPHDRTYNFFPQSPNCNMEYYHRMERKVYDFLDSTKKDDVFVVLNIELVYVDYYIEAVSPDRPRSIKVSIQYSNGKHETFELSNM